MTEHHEPSQPDGPGPEQMEARAMLEDFATPLMEHVTDADWSITWKDGQWAIEFTAICNDKKPSPQRHTLVGEEALAYLHGVNDGATAHILRGQAILDGGQVVWPASPDGTDRTDSPVAGPHSDLSAASHRPRGTWNGKPVQQRNPHAMVKEAASALRQWMHAMDAPASAEEDLRRLERFEFLRYSAVVAALHMIVRLYAAGTDDVVVAAAYGIDPNELPAMRSAIRDELGDITSMFDFADRYLNRGDKN